MYLRAHILVIFEIPSPLPFLGGGYPLLKNPGCATAVQLAYLRCIVKLDSYSSSCIDKSDYSPTVCVLYFSPLCSYVSMMCTFAMRMIRAWQDMFLRVASRYAPSLFKALTATGYQRQ